MQHFSKDWARLLPFVILLLFTIFAATTAILENEEPTYYQGNTFVATFRTQQGLHDRMEYIPCGFSSDRAIYEWLKLSQAELENCYGPSIILNAQILKP